MRVDGLVASGRFLKPGGFVGDRGHPIISIDGMRQPTSDLDGKSLVEARVFVFHILGAGRPFGTFAIALGVGDHTCFLDPIVK